MRRIFFLSAILYSGVFAFSQNNIDVLHYKFNIGLNDVNDTIYGLTEITLANPRFANIDLDLTNNSKGRGMFVDSVWINRGKGYFLVPNADTQISFYKYSNNKLSVIYRLDKMDVAQERLKLKDTFKLLIHYHGIPADG